MLLSKRVLRGCLQPPNSPLPQSRILFRFGQPALQRSILIPTGNTERSNHNCCAQCCRWEHNTQRWRLTTLRPQWSRMSVWMSESAPLAGDLTSLTLGCCSRSRKKKQTEYDLHQSFPEHHQTHIQSNISHQHSVRCVHIEGCGSIFGLFLRSSIYFIRDVVANFAKKPELKTFLKNISATLGIWYIMSWHECFLWFYRKKWSKHGKYFSERKLFLEKERKYY